MGDVVQFPTVYQLCYTDGDRIELYDEYLSKEDALGWKEFCTLTVPNFIWWVQERKMANGI